MTTLKKSPSEDPEFSNWLNRLNAVACRTQRSFSWRHDGWPHWRDYYDRRLSPSQAWAEVERGL